MPCNNQTSATPPEFICPLTHEVFTDPMVSRWGTSFEREAILRYLNAGNKTCPVTGKELRPSYLVSNNKLKKNIDEWMGVEASESGQNDTTSTVDVLMGTGAPVVPKHFICPLSGATMTSPMISRDGINFEQSAITQWLKTNSACPITGNSLARHGVIPNNKLKTEIEQWQHRTGVTMDKVDLMSPEEVKSYIEKTDMQRLREQVQVERRVYLRMKMGLTPMTHTAVGATTA